MLKNKIKTEDWGAPGGHIQMQQLEEREVEILHTLASVRHSEGTQLHTPAHTT